MNVGQGTWDSAQLKTVVPLKRSWIFNLRAEWWMVSWLEWSFGACGLQRGDFVPLFFLEMQKEQRLIVIPLLRTEKNGGECSYRARSEPKELRYRATLCWPLHPQKYSTVLSPGLIGVFPNSVLRWRCHCLYRRYFSSASLVISLESFPLWTEAKSANKNYFLLGTWR